MTGRKYSAGSAYRYGFNGKENDNEVKGEGNQQDYGMRIYDPRLDKFLSVDPLSQEYPELTPYQFASNSPIEAIDLDGAEAQSSKQTNENATQGAKPTSLLEKLDNVLLGGSYKNDKNIDVLNVGIKNQSEEIIKYRGLKQQAMGSLLNSDPNSQEAKANLELYNQYDEIQNKHLSSLKFLIQQRYKAIGQDKAVGNYQAFIDNELNLLQFGTNAMLTAASLIPSGGSSAGFFLSSTEIRASIFSLKGGYGLFGKGGLKVGGYKIESLYATPRVGYGTGTIFSMKQIGKQGGSFLRWDYGLLHGTNRLGLHSSFRFKIGDKLFGSSNQYNWSAPFKFWRYQK